MTPSSTAAKPTRALKKLLDRIGSEPICLIRDEKGRWIYTLVNGEPVHARVVKQGIDKGFIVPGNDALFDSKQSQTWRKAQ
jgi:hypothetical protein